MVVDVTVVGGRAVVDLSTCAVVDVAMVVAGRSELLAQLAARRRKTKNARRING